MTAITPTRRGVLGAFSTAQRAWAQAHDIDSDSGWTSAMRAGEQARQELFRASAIAASRALSAKITLQELADANRQACADLMRTTPKATLYTSVAAVAYHAWTGDLLLKPSSPDEPPVVPTEAQSLIVKVQRARSARAVKEAIGKSYTQQDAVRALNATLPVAARPDSPRQHRSNTPGGAGGSPSTNSTQAAELETLLARAIGLIRSGTRLTPASRGHVQTLAGIVAAKAHHG